MTRAIPPFYSVSEREYKNLLGFFKYLAIAGGTAMLTGLAGVVANQFIDSESSETLRSFTSNGLPTVIAGGFATLYGGINYFGNRSLNKKVGNK